MQNEINEFIYVAFELGKEILNKNNKTQIEKEFLDKLDNLSELVVKK